jgi:hypothetical protein
MCYARRAVAAAVDELACTHVTTYPCTHAPMHSCAHVPMYVHVPPPAMQDRRGEMQEHAVLGTGRTLLKCACLDTGCGLTSGRTRVLPA